MKKKIAASGSARIRRSRAAGYRESVVQYRAPAIVERLAVVFRFRRSLRLRDVSVFFFSSRRRHTRLTCDWSSDLCSSDLDDLDHARMRVGRLIHDVAPVAPHRGDGE